MAATQRAVVVCVKNDDNSVEFPATSRADAVDSYRLHEIPHRRRRPFAHSAASPVGNAAVPAPSGARWVLPPNSDAIIINHQLYTYVTRTLSVCGELGHLHATRVTIIRGMINFLTDFLLGVRSGQRELRGLSWSQAIKCGGTVFSRSHWDRVGRDVPLPAGKS